jgi:pyruvate/2-oxoglutarate dehydrogenase complex dihydrolipoamide dehydrogenase (E3) component
LSTTAKHFDAFIIRTVQAGPAMAARFAGAGIAVAIIEPHKFGGTCVNTGCTPTKTLVASAYAVDVARRGAEYGCPGTWSGEILHADSAALARRRPKMQEL